MILEYGSIDGLKDTDWVMMEFRSEKTVEPTLRRIGHALPGIFQKDPIQLFLPVVKRDLDVFDLSTGSYAFVRSTNFSSLLRLRTITGVVGLVTQGDTNHPSDVIRVSHEYVHSLIKEAEDNHANRVSDIELGSFVRVLDGETRDLCGTVENLDNGRAIVRIIMCTKSILLETPIRNLLNISHVPLEHRVYYFGPLVENLVKDLGKEGELLFQEDLRLDKPEMPMDIPNATSDTPKKHSRQRTITALVKKMILIEGKHLPMEIAKAVIVALKKGDIKAPKNLFIVYCLVKDLLMKNYFKEKDPNITNYREVIRKYGSQYKFSAEKIAKLDPSLGLPLSSSTVKKKTKTKPRGPKKHRKLSANPCGECTHTRGQHQRAGKESWTRCSKCRCKRFKEKVKKVLIYDRN
jgi:hypothetical protein